MWRFQRPGDSGFSGTSTAEEVLSDVDGSGLTAVVTGASSGIGFETARVLAKRGVNVVMGVRNTKLGESAKTAILKESPSGNVDVMELDLSSMDSVRNFASNYQSKAIPLNILINNAGIMGIPFALSKDQIEMQFATNHIGHFLLTELLRETMKKTAMESNRKGRIVNVSSRAHHDSYSQGIRFDNVNDPSRYNYYRAYGQSKLANILHANELARRLKEEGDHVTANSLHPGGIRTNLFRSMPVLDILVSSVGKFYLKNVQQGAATTCYVALHPKVEGVSGEYFSDCNLAKTSAMAQNVGIAKVLWDFSSDLANLL